MSNFGNKRCAYIYEKKIRRLNIKNGMNEYKKIAECWKTEDGRKFNAISYIVNPDSNGYCSNIIPYHDFLGEVYPVNYVDK